MPTSPLAALRALADITTNHTPPTPQHIKDLSTWHGWGPLAPALNLQPTDQWVSTADELAQLLESHPAWATGASEAVDTSFYTPTWLVEDMASILTNVGYTGGHILEPGCGSGRFMSANLPDTQYTGVESDHVSASIAQLLHPEATIINQPLQAVSLREGQFDAVLANVPFAPQAPYDPDVQARSLHQYFMLRALKALRPGGYLVAITSARLFDSPAQVDPLIELGDLHAVVRLPSGTFKGTSAIADLFIMQRRAPGEPVRGWNDYEQRGGEGTYNWSTRTMVQDRLTLSDPGNPWRKTTTNIYFQHHPDHVAGTMSATGYDKAPITVKSSDPRSDVQRALAAACINLPALTARPTDEHTADFTDVNMVDELGRKEGSYHMDGDTVVRITDGSATPVARPSKELRRLITLRDMVSELLDADTRDAHLGAADPDHNQHLRQRLLAAYQDYVADFGPLGRGQLVEGALDPETGEPKWTWRRPTLGGFRKDPDWMLVAAIELYNPDTQTGEPAPLLHAPVNRRPTPITSADSPEQALAVSLGTTARVDLDLIANLLGLATAEQARDALGDLVYTDPTTGETVTATAYLSGNVRAKFDQAVAAAKTNPAYADNVTALAQVVPDDYGPLQIHVTLGSPWITPDVINQFGRDVLDKNPNATYTPGVGVWEVQSTWYGHGDAARLQYGTKERDPLQLLEAALNSRTVIIYDEVYDQDTRSYKKVRNNEATLAAASKIEALQERFSYWVWEDKSRSENLVRRFNDQFRSHVPRRYDGSSVMLDTMSPHVTMWPWQTSVIERITTSPRTLCAHPVGRGKTLSALGAAVSLRRLGLANKPLISVPGHLLEQIATDALRAFPSARFLVATKEDLSKDNRRLFAARCATGDWDAVIMTHESLGSIPVSPDIEERWVIEQKLALGDAVRGGDDGSSYGRGAKAVAAAMRKFDARIAALRDGMGKDDLVTFEQLGVDFLAVDEVHMFRRLQIDSRTQGFSLGSAKRATDLMLKVHSLGLRRGDQPHFAGFTGTPWSNTLAETYVWQKFFQPDRLHEAGIATFDEWASLFVRFVTAVEVAPDGSGFRLHTRPSEVVNARVLMGMFTEVADFIDPDDEFTLNVPDGAWHTEVVEPTVEQVAFVKNLVERADKIRTKGAQSTDNMLSICGDGRRVALDPHLVGISQDAPKVRKVARTVAGLHHDYAHVTLDGAQGPGILQLLICDQGTPGDQGSQTYGRLKAALVDEGIDPSAIRYVHEATTDKARAALFAACRDGSVSVLIGSTPKVGIGTNVQTRLRALHHVDAPWRPSDVEQREGRAMRPGNLNPHVDIYRYVTRGTFDAYMWQTLETKARFIAALMRATVTDDTLSDIGDQVLSFGEVKALAAGNPLLLEQSKLAVEARRLRTLEAMHNQNVGALRSKARDALIRAERLRGQAAYLTAFMDEHASCEQEDTLVMQARNAAHAIINDDLRSDRFRSSGRRWGALDVEINARESSRRRIVVDLSLKYRNIGQLQLSRSQMREAPGAVLHGALVAFVGDAPHQVVALQAKADAQVSAATEARAAAEASVFDKADELAHVLTLLEQINVEIAGQSVEPLPAAA